MRQTSKPFFESHLSYLRAVTETMERIAQGIPERHVLLFLLTKEDETWRDLNPEAS
jgi:hypothetical protein